MTDRVPCRLADCPGYLMPIGRDGALACVACSRRLAQVTAQRVTLEEWRARIAVLEERKPLSDVDVAELFVARFETLLDASRRTRRTCRTIGTRAARGRICAVKLGRMLVVSRADVTQTEAAARERATIERGGRRMDLERVIAALPRARSEAISPQALGARVGGRSKAAAWAWLKRLGARPELRRVILKPRNGELGRSRVRWWWSEASHG